MGVQHDGALSDCHKLQHFDLFGGPFFGLLALRLMTDFRPQADAKRERHIRAHVRGSTLTSKVDF